MTERKKLKYNNNELYSKCPEPVVSKLNSDTHFGAISENLESIISQYCAESNVSNKIKYLTKDNYVL